MLRQSRGCARIAGPAPKMKARKLAAARFTVAVAHILLGLLLLFPIAVVAGLSSLKALAQLPFDMLLVGLVMTALPMGILLAGLRALWRLTPRAIRALQIADALAVVAATVLCGFGALALRTAGESAARGGGLLGAFGLVPLALGLATGGLAVVSLWLLRYLSRKAAVTPP